MGKIYNYLNKIEKHFKIDTPNPKYNIIDLIMLTYMILGLWYYPYIENTLNKIKNKILKPKFKKNGEQKNE